VVALNIYKVVAFFLYIIIASFVLNRVFQLVVGPLGRTLLLLMAGVFGAIIFLFWRLAEKLVGERVG